MEYTMFDKYNQLKKNHCSGKWAFRLLSELQYLLEISRTEDGKYDVLLNEKINELYQYSEENGAVTREICLKLERDLDVMREDAKALTVLLIAHAHIDMNWMWGFNETASLAISTFETMLQLMREYPQFKFSQSQASVYKIVEDYAPYLLPEIRQRIAEGRWEVTASSWVENDKNMSGTEAMARHLLYTKQYLSRLLDINMDNLNIDFEPDTFGHCENLPEILTQGGVKYYYHCRGHHKEHIYRWRAPSGAEVLVYREPVWYNDEQSAYDALGYIPSFCKEHGIQKTMKFYGVGDHGGGPTRKEIHHWLEMQEWPLMPVITFGTIKEFFESLEEKRGQFPVVNHELNYIFPGCYTTQARIKRANKLGEDRLCEAETVDVMAKYYAPDYVTGSSLTPSWKKILFNQFHDILPGSGVLETSQYALGEFQNAIAAAQVNMNHALKSISDAMDTSIFGEEGCENDSFGAGVGFGTGDACGYKAGFSGHSMGRNRVITVTNPTQYFRREVVKCILWDWEGDPALLSVVDAQRDEIPFQILKTKGSYWAHTFYEILLEVEVPAYGYNSYMIREKNRRQLDIDWEWFSATAHDNPRLDTYNDAPIILENDKIKVVFDASTMMLTSFLDKESGKEFLDAPAGAFRMITENPVNRYIAWRVGPYEKTVNISEHEKVKILQLVRGPLVNSVEYEIEFADSKLSVIVSLAKGSSVLDLDVTVDWHELGSEAKGIPQLNFTVPLGYTVNKYRCSIPGGIIDREPYAQDVPCLGYMDAVGADKKSVCVMSDCKYGFRGTDNTVSVTLLRGAYDPDPTPDQGEHHFRLGIGIVTDKEDLTEKHETYIHPIYTCSGSVHEGKLPVAGSLFQTEGNFKVTAVKQAEDGDGVILRIQNLEKEATAAVIRMPERIRSVMMTDIQERETEAGNEAISVLENGFSVRLPAAAVRTVKVVSW